MTLEVVGVRLQKVGTAPPLPQHPNSQRTEALRKVLATLRKLIDELYARHHVAVLVLHGQGQYRSGPKASLFVMGLVVRGF